MLRSKKKKKVKETTKQKLDVTKIFVPKRIMIKYNQIDELKNKNKDQI